MMTRVYFLIALTIIAWHSKAHELTTKISLDFEYSDNSFLAPNRGKVSDTQTIPALNIDYKLTFSTFDATLQYNASRTEYRDDTFDDRNDVLGEGTILWTIISNRLFWNFYQNRNRLTIDSEALDTPANETERNVIRTGPEFKLNFSRDSFLNIGFDYVDSSFDQGDLTTSNQKAYYLEYQRGIGARTQVGVTAQYSDVESEKKVLDYTNERLGFTLSGQGRKWQYDLTAGSNKIKRSLRDSVSGPFLRFMASYNATRSSWRIAINRELTDSTTGLTLSSNLSNGLSNGDANFDNVDLVERSRIELSYQNDIVPGRWSFGASASFDRQDFESLPQDEDSTDFNLDLTYQFRNNLSLVYRFDWQHQEFDESLTTDSQSISRGHRLDLRYTPNSKQHYIVWISDNQRDLAMTNLDYEEFTAGITLEYQL